MYLRDKEVEVQNCESFSGKHQSSDGGWVNVCMSGVFQCGDFAWDFSRRCTFFAPHRTTRNTRVKWQRRRVSKFSIILRFSLFCTFCCCCQRSENGNDRGKVVTRQWYILMTFFSLCFFGGGWRQLTLKDGKVELCFLLFQLAVWELGRVQKGGKSRRPKSGSDK